MILYDLLIMTPSDPCRTLKLRSPISGERGDGCCRGNEDLVLQSNHGGVSASHKWFCRNMYIPEHLVTFPTANEVDCIWFYIPQEEVHCITGAKGLGWDVAAGKPKCATHFGGSIPDHGSEVGSADGAPFNGSVNCTYRGSGQEVTGLEVVDVG